MRRILPIIFFILFFPFFSQKVSAVKADATILYDYDVAGRSTVAQNITLTNEADHQYATTYALTIEGQLPENLEAHDQNGSLKVLTRKTSDQSLIATIYFPDPVVGNGASRQFSVTYSSLPAQRVGQVWEIVLPQMKNSDFFDNFTVILSVPQELGQPAYLSPRPDSVKSRQYIFTKSQLGQNPIVAVFGNFQTYSFDITYHLQNTKNSSQVQSVAVIPDTTYQKVFYTAMEPAPVTVDVDHDGNWLAKVKVPAKSSQTFRITGQVNVLPSASPISLFPTSEQLQKYLLPDMYWDSQDPQIVSLARLYQTPEAIFNYVSNYLHYDSNAARGSVSPRRGSLQALDQPDHSLCTDFTDLFIAITRAAGIPSRALVGYTYTKDEQNFPSGTYGDILHTWPEYWDAKQNTWISVDPTWASTSKVPEYFSQFDIKHIVFAIQGENSQAPLPAGLYRSSVTQTNVHITPSEYQDYPQIPPSHTWIRPFQILPFVKNTSYLEVKNHNHQAVYWFPVSIAMSGHQLISASQSSFAIIPPYGKISIPVVFRTGIFPEFTTNQLSVRLGSLTVNYNIPSQLYLTWHVFFAITISTIIILVAWSAARSWSIYLQKRNR